MTSRLSREAQLKFASRSGTYAPSARAEPKERKIMQPIPEDIIEEESESYSDDDAYTIKEVDDLFKALVTKHLKENYVPLDVHSKVRFQLDDLIKKVDQLELKSSKLT